MKQFELFRIVMGAQIWTLTSADKDQTYDAGSGNEVYVATAMSRSNAEQKQELARSNLEVKIPIDHELAIILLTSFSEQIVTLTVYTKLDVVTFVSWKGRLAGLKPGESDLGLNFESIFTSMRCPGLRARFQKTCRHALYGRGCKLNPASFDVAATLSAISGNVLTIPAAASAADGRYTGGMVAAPDGTLSYIVNHSGSLITVQRLSYAMAQAFVTTGPGMAVTLYPGCKHTRADCNDFFNNLSNYGGFDWIPNKNPTDGISIA